MKPKPCPFCGHEPRLVDLRAVIKTVAWDERYFIECGNIKCHIRPSTGRRKTTKIVVEQWNTREAQND